MRFPISRFTVNGNSMYHTLKHGRNVLSIIWFLNPRIGDIVVIKKAGKEIVKRIIKISRSEVFVEGDNKNESTDSRHFGPINMDQVVGRVVYGPNQIDCPICSSPVIGIYGRKDAICRTCGFKLVCCGE